MVGRGGNDVSIGIGDVEDSGAFITKNKNNGGSTMPRVALYCHLPKGQGILRHIALLFYRVYSSGECSVVFVCSVKLNMNDMSPIICGLPLVVRCCF